MKTLRQKKLKRLCNLKYFTLLFLLVLFSCKKHDVKSTEEPFNPSFTIYEPFYGSSNIYSTDTIVTYRATFSADDTYDSYAWTVGDDPTVRTTKSFTLNFPLSESGNTLSARLIASKKSKFDTVIKRFTIYAAKGTLNETLTSYSTKLLYLGKFEGNYEDAPSHKFTVTITNLDTSTAAGSFKDFRVLNLPEGCGGKYVSGENCTVADISPTYYSYSFDYTYKAFYVNEGDEIGCCPKVNLYGYVDSSNANRIIIDCIFLHDTQKAIKRKFIGTRL